MSLLAPAGFTEQFPFVDRLADVLNWAGVCGRLTLQEVEYVEWALDEERRRRAELVKLLLADCWDVPATDLEAVETAYHNGRADGFAHGVAFAERRARLEGAA